MLEKLGNKSLVVIKQGKVIFESEHGRLRPIVECIKNNKEAMEGSVVIDKIVGLAAAKLLVFAKVGEIYSKIASRTAVDYLEGRIHAEKVVEMIMNDNSDEQCPMEKLAEKMEGKELFEKLNK